MELIEVLSKIAEHQIVYHLRNNEILIDSNDARLINELINQSKPILKFATDINEHGCFINYIFIINNVLIIKQRFQGNSAWIEEILHIFK